MRPFFLVLEYLFLAIYNATCLGIYAQVRFSYGMCRWLNKERCKLCKRESDKVVSRLAGVTRMW